ncbi:MAG: DUF5058 family protein [Anaerovoracaceae bacterium]
MTYFDMANSRLLYILVILGLLIVVAMVIYYLIIYYKHCIKRGITKEKINEVIKSTIVLSIVPSFAITTGLVTLVAIIGIPYAWLRLSVLGSIAYELLASNMALDAIGTKIEDVTPETFGLLMFAMSIPITLTLFLNIFLSKKVHLGALKLGGRDEKWGALSQTVFMTTLIFVLAVPLIAGSIPSFLTFLTSAIVAVAITLLAKKVAPWLGNFTLALCLIIAMSSSILWDKLFG